MKLHPYTLFALLHQFSVNQMINILSNICLKYHFVVCQSQRTIIVLVQLVLLGKYTLKSLLILLYVSILIAMTQLLMSIIIACLKKTDFFVVKKSSPPIIFILYYYITNPKKSQKKENKKVITLTGNVCLSCRLVFHQLLRCCCVWEKSLQQAN